MKKVDKEIVSIPRKERTFENTLKPLLACDHKSQTAGRSVISVLMHSRYGIHS